MNEQTLSSIAAGYAACFDRALNNVAGKQNKEVESETTAEEVSFLKDPEDDGFKIGVTLTIEMKGVIQDEAGKLAEAAHDFCPFSKAT